MGVLTQTRRLEGTSRAGQSFSTLQIQQVWSKASVAPGYDPSFRRLDPCGAFIDFAKYGDTSSDTNNGWEIDHIIPVNSGGTDVLSNLQPLQWRNNRKKSDQYPVAPWQYAAVVAQRN